MTALAALHTRVGRSTLRVSGALHGDTRRATMATSSRERSTTPESTVSGTSSSRQAIMKTTATSTAQVAATKPISRVMFLLPHLSTPLFKVSAIYCRVVRSHLRYIDHPTTKNGHMADVRTPP